MSRIAGAISGLTEIVNGLPVPHCVNHDIRDAAAIIVTVTIMCYNLLL
jgi:hypothetical protein